MISFLKKKDPLCCFLFECTKDGHLEALDEVIGNIAKTNPQKMSLYINYKDDTKRTMFHWACYHGHLKVVKLLINHTTIEDRQALDMFGYSAMDLAIIHGYTDIVTLSSVGAISSNSHRQQAKLVQKLVEIGFKISLNGKGDFNCLHWACYNDNFQLVQYLLRQEDGLLMEKTVDDLFPIDMIFRQYKDPTRRRNQNQIFTFMMRWYMFKCGSCESPPDNRTSFRVEVAGNWGSLALGASDPEPVPQHPYRCMIRNPETFSHTDSQRSEGRTGLPRASKICLRPVVNESFIAELPELESPDRYDNWEFEVQVNPQEPNGREQMSFEINHSRDRLTINEEIELRFLYWSCYLGNLDFVIFCLRRKANPFMLDLDQYSALHIACHNGQNEVLTTLLDARYRYAANAEIQFDMNTAINTMSGTTPSSALHLAVEKDHIKTIILLLHYGCSIDQVNFRTLTPFELTKEKKITEYYHTKLKPLDPLNFVEQGFYYVLKAPGFKSLDDCIVNIQLMNIKETCRNIGVEFDFITVYSSDRTIQHNGCFYYVIRVPEETLSYWAYQLDLRCFNLKQGIIAKYDINEHQNFERFKDLQIQQIIYYLLNKEFDVNVFMQEKLLLSHYPLHNNQLREKISHFWRQEQWSCLWDPFRPTTNPQSLRPLHVIASYYGPKVGWYFAFLCQFTTWLLIPTIPGVAIGIYIVITQEVETALMPLYSIFMNLWATVFLEGWKRRESELAFFWDMHEFHQTQQVRYQYQGQYHIDSVTNKIKIKAKVSAFTKRLAMDGPVVILGLIILVANFVLFQLFIENLKGNRIALVAIGSANGVMINILVFLYREICKRVVEWENHEHQSNMEMSYVFKIFIFEFFNSYLTPGYQAIKKGDYELLTITVGSIIITRGLIHNTMSNILPYLKYLFDKRKFYQKHNEYLLRHQVKSSPQSIRIIYQKQKTLQRFIEQETFNFSETEIAEQSQSSVKLKVNQLLSIQEHLEFNNVMLDNKDLIDEYMYLAIQFGYITMFSPVFPIAPLFALINIYINLRLSLFTYQKLMKREQSEAADSIGIWINIFSAMNYFSTVMNCIVIYTTSSTQLATLIGPGDALRDAVVLFFVEHFILLIKFIFDISIPDIPEWVIRAKKKYIWLEQRFFEMHLKRNG